LILNDLQMILDHLGFTSAYHLANADDKHRDLSLSPKWSALEP
jgi:hypothetical protein